MEIKPYAKDNEALRFPFATAPAPGTLTDVAPGVQWLRMPLPFAGLNHINLWVLDDGDGWTVVDTGINTPETKQTWTDIFVGPLKGKPVKRILCTHYHPDHIGLAGWLAETHRAPLWITAGEMQAARYAHGLSQDISGPAAAKVYIQAGLESAIPAATGAHGGRYKRAVSDLPLDYTAIDPALPVEAAGIDWRIVVGEGHSPQMATLYSDKLGVLISGDQVLPGITPNVSVRDSQPDSNPLKLFLDSLERFRALPDETLVLPSHKLPFHGLRTRVDQLIRHHHDRLNVAREASRQGATGAEVLKALFKRELDAHQLAFALGETVAHLNYLVASGDVVREQTPGGIYRYTTVA